MNPSASGGNKSTKLRSIAGFGFPNSAILGFPIATAHGISPSLCLLENHEDAGRPFIGGLLPAFAEGVPLVTDHAERFQRF
jgi:hypothetical protein